MQNYHSKGRLIKIESQIYHSKGRLIKIELQIYHDRGRLIKIESQIYHGRGRLIKFRSKIRHRRMLGNHAQSERSATHRVRRNKKNERTSRPMLASKAAGMAFEDCSQRK